MKKKHSTVFTITLMLIASALTCLILMYNNGAVLSALRSSKYAAGREYTVLLEKIERMYIGEYDGDEVQAAAMRAAVDALGDRWSFYMTPQEHAEYLQIVSNQYAGIGVGVFVDEESGGIGVAYTYSGSPADKAGILAGDVITGIDGESLAGRDLDDMRELLARPVGEKVELTILRPDGTVEIISVVYDLVFVAPISYEMLDDNIGYIEIVNFEAGAADGFISAVEHLLEQGALAFVFDVRSNGGGRVTEMTQMLDYLLPEGEIFISVDINGKESIIWSDSEMVDVRAVVIVNRHSYSAAEYFAATLREYDYAEIVGEQTIGKSRSQRTEPLPGGGALNISTSQYLTKNRVSLFDAGGVTPDHPLSLTDEEIRALVAGNLDIEKDPQLMLALSLVR